MQCATRSNSAMLYNCKYPQLGREWFNAPDSLNFGFAYLWCSGPGAELPAQRAGTASTGHARSAAAQGCSAGSWPAAGSDSFPGTATESGGVESGTSAIARRSAGATAGCAAGSFRAAAGASDGDIPERVACNKG